MEPILRFKADDGSDFPDWEEEMLGELVEIQRGGSPRPISKFITTGEGINWIKIGDAPSHGNCITKVKERIIPEGKAKSREVHKGDLLLSNSMSFGRPYILGVDGCIHDGWLVVHDTNAVFETEFLCEYLGTESIFRQYRRLAAGSAVNNLNKDLVASVVLGVPSLPEQRKIADLLSAVDDVIAAQEAEVAAWEKRKKGVMQKLFSQEVRFKADDGSDFPDWEEKTLGDLGYFIRGLSYNKTQVLDDGSDAYGTAVLRSNNINSDGTLDYRDDVQLVSKEPSSEQQLCENDVVICMANGSNRLVGKAARYDGGYDARRITVGAFCGIFRTDSPLVPWWFQSDDYKSFLHLSKQGGDGALANLKGKDIEAISLLFPSSSTEQREIADCLASLDDVIAKAKDELDAWRELKKGLLQQMFV